MFTKFIKVIVLWFWKYMRFISVGLIVAQVYLIAANVKINLEFIIVILFVVIATIIIYVTLKRTKWL